MIIVRFGRLQPETALLGKVGITTAFQGVRINIYLRLLIIDNYHLLNVMVHHHLLNLPLVCLPGLFA